MAIIRQKRTIATREKILDALEKLLQTQEFESISIAALARAGSVAVGSVYSHFKDKNALLPALLDRQLARVETRVAELQAHGTVDSVPLMPISGTADLRSTIRLGLELTLKHISQTRGVRRALLAYRRHNPDLEIPLATTLAEQAFEALIAELELHRDEIRHDDLREAAKMINYFMNMAFLDRIVFLRSPFPERLTPSDEVLIETYTNMIHDYLTHE